MRTNDFKIEEHFKLYEFENASHEVKLDPTLPIRLERLRASLSTGLNSEVAIYITSGYRSKADNKALAARLGWIEDGGLVSKDSQHMHGRAADIVVVEKAIQQIIVPEVVQSYAVTIFPFVKTYEAHTHVDVRELD